MHIGELRPHFVKAVLFQLSQVAASVSRYRYIGLSVRRSQSGSLLPTESAISEFRITASVQMQHYHCPLDRDLGNILILEQDYQILHIPYSFHPEAFLNIRRPPSYFKYHFLCLEWYEYNIFAAFELERRSKLQGEKRGF